MTNAEGTRGSGVKFTGEAVNLVLAIPTNVTTSPTEMKHIHQSYDEVGTVRRSVAKPRKILIDT